LLACCMSLSSKLIDLQLRLLLRNCSFKLRSLKLDSLKPCCSSCLLTHESKQAPQHSVHLGPLRCTPQQKAHSS